MGIYERNYYRDDVELNLTPSWNGRSAVTVLIIANAVVFLANMLFSPGPLSEGNQGVINELLMLNADDLAKPWLWWRVITNGFTHSALSPFHLIFNMLGLYFLGRPVEDRYGTKEFYRIYFVSLAICSLGWLLIQRLSGRHDSLLGASGAVTCIEMLFVYNFPTARIIWFLFPVPAWVLGVFLVLTNMVSRPGSNVAFDVHLIGIACATAYFFLKLDFRFMDDLSQTWRRIVRRVTGPRLKLHSPTKQLAESEEADRILAKIHASGQDSLTSREKKFLEKYSRKVRERQKET
jgi:membrane associated rhomboid family serine protease